VRDSDDLVREGLNATRKPRFFTDDCRLYVLCARFDGCVVLCLCYVCAVMCARFRRPNSLRIQCDQ